jgi:hypothetical protein
MYLKFLEKQHAKPLISWWKEIIDIGQKLMKWKLKEQYKVSMKQRVGSLKEQRQL